MKKYPIILLCLIVSGVLSGQEDSLKIDWNPRVIGSDPVKGFEVSYHANKSFKINSTSESFGDGDGRIAYNRIFKTKLRFPVFINEKLKLAGAFEYSDEEIHFDDIEKHPYPLYQSLNEKNLKNIGGSMYLQTCLKRNMYFMLLLNAKLRGDYWKEHIGDVKNTLS